MNQSVIIKKENRINSEIERLNNSMDFITKRIFIDPIKSKEIEEKIDEKSFLSTIYNNSILFSPILNSLIDLGYNEKYSKRFISYFHPQNIEEAIDKLNEKDGKIQHNYIETKNDLCYVCGKIKENHISENDYDKSVIINNNDSFKKFNISLNNISLKDKIEQNNNCDNNLTKKDSSIDIEPKFICQICKNNLNENEKIILDKCKHFFCKKCILNFIKIKILENKVQFIKCLNYDCSEKLSNSLITELIKDNENLLSKYNEYKFRLEIINNPNKKFCPYPNCDSYLIKNENPNELISKCKNEHEYCFKCLNKPHKNNICEENIDDENIKQYAKNKFIKKCPKCGTYTEKNEGCNHMICLECNYQWCWLCNEQYDYNHYINGKCKGYQFFQPKNENDIKLAFEKKIKLRRNERQIEFDNINFFIDEELNGRKNFCYFLLYLFLGQKFHIICNLPRLVKIDSFSSRIRSFFTVFYNISIFFLWISYFFLQFFLNIISFITCWAYFGINLFFNGWDYYLELIIHLNVYSNANIIRFNVVSKNINFIYRVIFNIFFGVFFMDFPFLYRNIINIDNFPLIFNYLYCFSVLIIQFIYFFFQSLLNFLIIVISIIINRSFHEVNDRIKYFNKEIFDLKILKKTI